MDHKKCHSHSYYNCINSDEHEQQNSEETCLIPEKRRTVPRSQVSYHHQFPFWSKCTSSGRRERNSDYISNSKKESRRHGSDDLTMLLTVAVITVMLTLALFLSCRGARDAQKAETTTAIGHGVVRAAGTASGQKNPFLELAQSVSGTEERNHVLSISQGLVQGKRLSTREGREYLAFLGIPYGKPPVNELRFKPPLPADGWSGILNATVFGSECMQDHHGAGVTGSEDCLKLNVFTPKATNKLVPMPGSRGWLFPVIVYFHGGGLSGNVFHNDGKYLLDEDVILVTLHYRLGPFGNLNVHTLDAAGNQGLKDQVLALKWIQSNIINFGGDPQKVTLFGESSGASGITGHLLSPMSKGLFSRVICQSGSILVSSEFSRHTLEDAFSLGEKINCSTGTEDKLNLQELINCLQSVDAEKLVVKLEDAAPKASFMVSVESEPLEGQGQDDVFLTNTALKILQSGNFSNFVPAIFGVNNYEGILSSLPILKTPSLINDFYTNPEEFIRNWLHFAGNPNANEIVKKIYQFYFNGRNFSPSADNNDEDVARNLTDMFSDRDVIHPVYMTAYFVMKGNQYHADNKNWNDTPVYLYHMDQQVIHSYWVQKYGDKINVTIDDVKGTGHIDELQFLFEDAGFNYPPIPIDSPLYDFSRMVVRLWASFADTGIPNTSFFTGIAHAPWIPVAEPRPLKFYQLNGNESKMSNALDGRMNFWDSLNLSDLYF